MIAFGLLWIVGGTIIGLAIGGIVLDLGTQANLVTNQTRVYRLIPEARNRINTVFMVTYFVGGALGTFLAGFAWSWWQWNGVCALGASFFGAALIVWAVGSWESDGASAARRDVLNSDRWLPRSFLAESPSLDQMMGDRDRRRHPKPSTCFPSMSSRAAALYPAHFGELVSSGFTSRLSALAKHPIISEEGNGQGCVA